MSVVADRTVADDLVATADPKPIRDLKLDRLDFKILTELQANSRITYKTLSDRVALSASACLSRVKLLEQAGFIAGYHARVSAAVLEPALVMIAEISLSKHSVEDVRRVDTLLRSMPEIVEVMRVSGPFDYLARLVVADMQAWREFAGRLMNNETGIDKMISHLVIEEVKSFTGYPLPPRRRR
jgi:Lrp/AsnC family leucine-responsive transcriptional regulator